MAIYETDRSADQLSNIRKMIEWHKEGKIEILSSTRVKEELKSHHGKPEKEEKAEKALMLMEDLNIKILHYPIGVVGMARVGFSEVA